MNPSTVIPKSARGFTLIELMVAMVIGLIVIGAVLALSLSMIRANSDTIAGTRLTQELRATSSAITSELQRAGSAADPFNLTAAMAIAGVDDTVAGCIRYAYSYIDPAGTVVPVSRAISRAGNAIYVGDACGNAGTRLSSARVDIDDLRFDLDGRALNLSVSGTLKLSKDEISREYVQSVFAPSLGT